MTRKEPCFRGWLVFEDDSWLRTFIGYYDKASYTTSSMLEELEEEEGLDIEELVILPINSKSLNIEKVWVVKEGK